VNLTKNFWPRIRRHLLWGVIDSLNTIKLRIEDLHNKVGDAERALRTTQLEINHYQSSVLTELKDRAKNSGTLVLSETELLTKIFSGLKMYLDPRDRAITPHLALDGIWEHRITAAWLKVLKPGMTVFDIGANNGYYGVLAAQKAGKDAKVVMFEANPHLITYIQRTVDVNFLGKQATLENVAVADKSGELTLNILKDYVGSSSVYSDDRVKTYMPNKWQVETEEAIKVHAITIDGYCKQHKITTVDLIIMDIEGFEDKAYGGMRKTIAASPNATLFVEFTPRAYEDPKAFYELMLKDFGHVYVLNDDGSPTVPPDASYKAIIGDTDDWVMPIFSKNAKLAEK
jgi:FkbM family methyltransferase